MTNSNDNKLRNVRDFKVEYVTLIPSETYRTKHTDHTTINFKRNYVSFSYEESIFMPGVHGSLFAVDAIDYPTLLPMIGEERLQIEFRRQELPLTDKISFDLPIYLIDGKYQDGGGVKKRQTYTMYYGSDFVFKNINEKINKTYKNMKYSEMVQDIYDNYLKIGNKKIVIEETEGNFDFNVHNLGPMGAIKKIASLSVSAEGNGSSYLFYEDRENFYFITMTKLATQKPGCVYTLDANGKIISKPIHNITLNYNPKNISDPNHVKNLEVDLYSVDTINNISQGLNSLKSALSGEAVSSLLSIDPLTRKISLNALDLRGENAAKNTHGIEILPNIKDGWNSFNHMNNGDDNIFKGKKPWTDNNKMFINPLTNLNVKIAELDHQENDYIKSKINSSNLSQNPMDYFLQRNSQFLQLMRNVITTRVSGDPRIRAGTVLKFNIPENLGKIDKSDGVELNKYLQGNYLVVSVAHIISGTSYYTNLELIKDSFFSDINPRNPFEEYKHIF